jgi:hypothetical protein
MSVSPLLNLIDRVRVLLLRSDAASVMAAVAVANGTPRLSALKESPFLPSVSGENWKIF